MYNAYSKVEKEWMQHPKIKALSWKAKLMISCLLQDIETGKVGIWKTSLSTLNTKYHFCGSRQTRKLLFDLRDAGFLEIFGDISGEKMFTLWIKNYCKIHILSQMSKINHQKGLAATL